MPMPASMVTPVLIGREGEMEILDGALHAARNGVGGCLLLTGEAGIGKSRLAAELSQHASTANFMILQGYCSEQDGSLPYAPWMEALRAFLAPKNKAETIELLGPFAPELAKLLPELAELLPSVESPASLDATAEKHRLFETLARFMSSLAAIQPLLVILEDLHWSDEQSLELLRFLVKRIASAPILILGTYRSEDVSPRLAHRLADLNRDRLVQEIELTPLPRPAVGEMVRAISGSDAPIGPDWLDLLMPLTEGNPFFVEEITGSLLQAGSRPGEWDPLRIPRSIQQTVLHRLEALPAETRSILLLASVIGERFDFALLQEVAGEDEPSLLRILKESITAQLIIEQSADLYAFRHALTRQVIYATLLLRERKALHQKIAEALERFTGKQADPPVAQLAHHFFQAGDWKKTLDYSQQAGEKAQALYAPREALTHFSHSLEAAGQLGLPTPLPSLRGRAAARAVLGDLEGARTDYQTALDLARQSSDRRAEWRALIDLGLSWQSRDLEKEGEYFQLALQLARGLDEAPVLARSLNRLGNWHYFRGRPREALSLHHEALEIFGGLEDRRGMAETLALLGLASYGVGDMIQGAAYYEQAVPLLREVDDRQGLVHALEFLSLRAHFDTEILGEVVLSELTKQSEMALQTANNISWRQGEAEAASRAGICQSLAGEYGRGLDFLQHAQMIGEEIGHRHLLVSIHLIVGELYLGLLAPEQARHHLELALGFAREVGAALLLGSVPPPLVSTCILQGDLARAQEVLNLLSLTKDIDEIENAGTLERRCWSAQVELELALNRPQRALEIVDRMIGSAQNLGRFGPHAIPWLSQLRAQSLAGLGRLEEAAAELVDAQRIARARGALPLLWRLHADLGRVYHRLGRRGLAREEFSVARSIIQDVAKHVPAEELRENFVRQALATLPAEPVPTSRQAAKREFGGLTTREREIAGLIAHGKSNREIANELVISEKTAERHVANIHLKLGFSSRTEIAAWFTGKSLEK